MRKLIALVGEETVAEFTKQVSTGLLTGQDVSFGDWGRFPVHKQPAAQARDPRTGKIAKIPAKWSVGLLSGPFTKKVIKGGELTEASSPGRVLGAIAKVLKQGESLELERLGTFTLVHKEGFTGRARGKSVRMKPRTVLVFRLEPALKERVDEAARSWRRSE
jgi:nucleoid DNA-binding protein